MTSSGHCATFSVDLTADYGMAIASQINPTARTWASL
jgi:hypothetical protein